MTQKNFLKGGTITLRAVEVTDVDTLYLWENDSTQWDSSNALAPYSRKQLWDYANEYDGDIYKSRNLRFMVTLTQSGESIGTVDIYNFDSFHNHAYIGVFITACERRKGYASTAIRLATDYTENYLGIKQLCAVIASGNTKSIKAFEQCGFKQCGLFKSWLRHGKAYDDAMILQHLT